MAQDSRSVRRKRRVRKNLSESRRMVKALQQAYLRSHSSLLMVLAQRGPITVTQGTMTQVIQQLQTLNWQSQSGENPGEVVFSIAPDETQDQTPALTVKRIVEDDEVPVILDSEQTDAAVDAAVAEASGTVQTLGDEVV